MDFNEKLLSTTYLNSCVFSVSLWYRRYPWFMDYEELIPVVISPTKYKNTAFQEDLRFLKVQTLKKFCGKFQNRIPRELNQNFDIPRISMIHWITSNFFKQKTPIQKICRFLKWGASPRRSPSLYYPMRNSGGMTIGNSHPTLIPEFNLFIWF